MAIGLLSQIRTWKEWFLVGFQIICPRAFSRDHCPVFTTILYLFCAGLQLSSNEEDLALLLLATTQSLAYSTLYIINQLESCGHHIESLLLCGGLMKNPLYVQAHANAIQRPVLLPQETEAVLLGGCLFLVKLFLMLFNILLNWFDLLTLGNFNFESLTTFYLSLSWSSSQQLSTSSSQVPPSLPPMHPEASTLSMKLWHQCLEGPPLLLLINHFKVFIDWSFRRSPWCWNVNKILGSWCNEDMKFSDFEAFSERYLAG